MCGSVHTIAIIAPHSSGLVLHPDTDTESGQRHVTLENYIVIDGTGSTDAMKGNSNTVNAAITIVKLFHSSKTSNRYKVIYLRST